MYDVYFGLSEPPFENNLDQRFFFLSDNHKEVIEALLFFVREGKGFALVCGDVGTGKTMLINSFLDQLPDSVRFIVLSNPDTNYLNILRYIARKLKIDTAEMGALELFDAVREALTNARKQGQRFVLIIDEAHLLPNEALEGVRLLSNIETRQDKLLQILLVGQYELSHKLDRVEMRQLRERININRFLSPMDQSETIEYVDHRLKVARGSFDSCFDSKCKNLIYRMTQGVPRRVNLLCDHALLVCASLQLRRVNKKVLKRAQDALRSDRIFAPKAAHSSDSGLASHIRRLTIIGICVTILVLVGMFMYGSSIDSSIKRIVADIYHPSATLPEKNTKSAQSPPTAADVTKQEQTEKLSNVQTAAPAQANTKKEHDAQLQPQTMGRPMTANSTGKSPLNNGDRQTQIPRRSSADANPDRKQKLDDPATGPKIVGRNLGQSASEAPSNEPALQFKSAYPETNSSAQKADPSPQKQATIDQETGRADEAVSASPSSSVHLWEPLTSQNQNRADLPIDKISAAAGSQEQPGRDERSPQSGLSASPLQAAPEKAESELSSDKLLQQRKLRTVKKGDTLLKIASEFKPDNPEDGLRKILRLNPSISDLDRIYPGQVIVLSTSDAPNYEVQPAKEGLHYSIYGKYKSWQDLKQVMTQLAKKNVKHLIVNTPDSVDGSSHEVIIGGYETAAALEDAIKRLNN